MPQKPRMIPLQPMHLAMVYRMAGEQPPEDLPDVRCPPCHPISSKMACLAMSDMESTQEFARKCGYGNERDHSGGEMMVDLSWLLSMLSRPVSEMAKVQLSDDDEPIGVDGQTDHERKIRHQADLFRENEEEEE